MTAGQPQLEPGGYQLTPHSRLADSSDFRRVFAKNVSASNRHFVALARSNNRGHPRLGMAVAKKHLRRAVDRNRVKRLIRETFRLQQRNLDSVDIVVLVKSGISAHNKQVLRQSLDSLWAKLSEQLARSSSA
ncbi:MAG: ribonuclease P protein component [Pseudomonadota bacterium]